MAFKKEVIDGVEHLVATIEFDLGEIKPFKDYKNKDGHRVISMNVGIKTSMEILKESILNAVKSDNYENFENHLEEYSRLYLNDVIGVQSYPLRYNENGSIEGIKKEE